MSDASKRPLPPALNRSPAPCSLIAGVRHAPRRLRACSETVSLARLTPERAVRLTFNTGANCEPIRLGAAEMFPAFGSGVVRRTKRLERRRTVGFRFGVPFQNSTRSHPLPMRRWRFVMAPARRVFDPDEKARKKDVCTETGDGVPPTSISRKPG